MQGVKNDYILKIFSCSETLCLFTDTAEQSDAFLWMPQFNFVHPSVPAVIGTVTDTQMGCFCYQHEIRGIKKNGILNLGQFGCVQRFACSFSAASKGAAASVPCYRVPSLSCWLVWFLTWIPLRTNSAPGLSKSPLLETIFKHCTVGSRQCVAG